MYCTVPVFATSISLRCLANSSKRFIRAVLLSLSGEIGSRGLYCIMATTTTTKYCIIHRRIITVPVRYIAQFLHYTCVCLIRYIFLSFMGIDCESTVVFRTPYSCRMNDTHIEAYFNAFFFIEFLRHIFSVCPTAASTARSIRLVLSIIILSTTVHVTLKRRERKKIVPKFHAPRTF